MQEKLLMNLETASPSTETLSLSEFLYKITMQLGITWPVELVPLMCLRERQESGPNSKNWRPRELMREIRTITSERVFRSVETPSLSEPTCRDTMKLGITWPVELVPLMCLPELPESGVSSRN